MNIIRLGPRGLNLAHMIEWEEPPDRPGVVRVSMVPGVWREFNGDAARKFLGRVDQLDRPPAQGRVGERELPPEDFDVDRPGNHQAG